MQANLVQCLYKNAFAHFDVTRIIFIVFGNKIANWKKDNEMCTNNLMNYVSLLRTSLCFQ